MTADPNNPEILASFATEIEAAAVVNAIRESGIEVLTTGSFTAGFRAEAPGAVHVVVRNEDLDRAKKLLATIGQYKSEVDWSNIDVGDAEDQDDASAFPS